MKTMHMSSHIVLKELLKSYNSINFVKYYKKGK